MAERAVARGRFETVAPGALERATRPHRHGLWGATLDLLLPRRCAGCRALGAWLCAACETRLIPAGDGACPRCGALDRLGRLCRGCREEPPAFDTVRAAVRHLGVGRELVRGLKYRGVRDLAPVMAVGLEVACRRLPVADHVLVPVPLHPERERSRGFNQSALLASALAARCGGAFSVAPAALARTRPTPPQVGLTRSERRANVAGAFSADPAAVRGRSVVVVDDVATTGATLAACAAALREAGAIGVCGLVFSRAGADAGDPGAGG